MDRAPIDRPQAKRPPVDRLRLAAAAVGVALLLAVAGCGGGEGSTTDPQAEAKAEREYRECIGRFDEINRAKGAIVAKAYEDSCAGVFYGDPPAK